MTIRRDTVYRQLFSHPEIVRDLVAGLLPADWAQALAVEAFERVNASYASDDGKARHADVVWRAQIGGEWVYVYILLEFQSRPDKWMALRMQVYVGLLYQDLVAQHRLSKHGKLPPVLPIVLYHGRQPWHAATGLVELMLPPPAGLEPFHAQLRYLLIDQHHGGVSGDLVGPLFRLLEARTELELRAAAKAFTRRMQRLDLAQVRTSLARWLQLTLQGEFGRTNMDWEEDFAMAPERKYKFEDVFTDEFFDRLLQPREEAEREGRQAGMERGLQEGRQQGMQEGRQKGWQEGRQEGRQEGMQQGERLALREVLNDLLVRRDVPAVAADRIAEADSGQLRAWIQSLIAGVSPRQLFAEG